MTAIVLDVETTGLNPHFDRITEIAIVSYTDASTLFHSFVNPGISISEEIEKLTGISNEKVKDSPAFSDIAKSVADIISNSIVMIGHNPYFDRLMISSEMTRSKTPIKFPITICTKRIWNIHEPKEERNLVNAYKRFVNKDGFVGAHGALADTLACRKVLANQLIEFDLTDVPWEEIDPEQRKWWGPSNHIIWSDGALIINFGKNKGIAVEKIDRKYWQWICGQDFPEHVKVMGDYFTCVAKSNITAEEVAVWAMGRDL